MATLMSGHLEERIERLREIEAGEDLPTLDEMPALARALNVHVEHLRAWCLFDEFSVLIQRWDVTPQRLMEIAQLYILEVAAEADGDEQPGSVN